MPTLLYGLTLPGDPVPAALAGVDGAACRSIPCGDVAAVVATVPAAPEPTLDAVRAHDAVLRQCVAAGATVAAVRFGQLFHDDAACASEVRQRSGRVAALLREHAGCVEMRVLLPVANEPASAPAAPAETTPGRAYLESLRARGDVAPNLALRPMLGPVVRAERIEGFASRRASVRGVAFAHLVERGRIAEYRESVRAIPSLADARMVGPLPLYSFAEPAP